MSNIWFIYLQGNAHTVYNGSFFYHQLQKPQIVKYELSTMRSQHLLVPHAFINETNYLYLTEYNYMDFSADDNGLWVIYGLPGSNNTAVMKIDSYSLEIQYALNISVKHNKAGEMFIVCGVLYVVESTTDRRSNIRYVDSNFFRIFNLFFGYNHWLIETFQCR